MSVSGLRFIANLYYLHVIIGFDVTWTAFPEPEGCTAVVPLPWFGFWVGGLLPSPEVGGTCVEVLKLPGWMLAGFVWVGLLLLQIGLLGTLVGLCWFPLEGGFVVGLPPPCEMGPAFLVGFGVTWNAFPWALPDGFPDEIGLVGVGKLTGFVAAFPTLEITFAVGVFCWPTVGFWVEMERLCLVETGLWLGFCDVGEDGLLFGGVMPAPFVIIDVGLFKDVFLVGPGPLLGCWCLDFDAVCIVFPDGFALLNEGEVTWFWFPVAEGCLFAVAGFCEVGPMVVLGFLLMGGFRDGVALFWFEAAAAVFPIDLTFLLGVDDGELLFDVWIVPLLGFWLTGILVDEVTWLEVAEFVTWLVGFICFPGKGGFLVDKTPPCVVLWPLLEFAFADFVVFFEGDMMACFVVTAPAVFPTGEVGLPRGIDLGGFWVDFKLFWAFSNFFWLAFESMDSTWIFSSALFPCVVTSPVMLNLSFLVNSDRLSGWT